MYEASAGDVPALEWISLKRNPLTWVTYSCKICMSRLDVKIQEVEDDTVLEVAESTVVDDEGLPSIDHLPLVKRTTAEAGRNTNFDVVELCFSHRLKMRNFGSDSS